MINRQLCVTPHDMFASDQSEFTKRVTTCVGEEINLNSQYQLFFAIRTFFVALKKLDRVI